MRVRSSWSQQRWEWPGEGVGWGWLLVVQSTSTVAGVLQEVLAGGSPSLSHTKPHFQGTLGTRHQAHESHSCPRCVQREAKVLSSLGKSHFARVLLFPNNLYESAKPYPALLWHWFPSELHPFP